MIYTKNYTTISDAWYDLLYNIQEHGYKQPIQRGSFAGDENYRIQYPFVAIEIEHPSVDMIPVMPQGMESLAPTTTEYVEDYFATYLMNDELKENEVYTYGSRICKYTDRLIEMLRNTPYTNQAVLEIASPGDIFLNDPPCMTKDSLLITKRGVINADLVKVGDQILTHTGNFNKVTKIHKRRVTTKSTCTKEQGGRQISTFTPEHPILSLQVSSCPYIQHSIAYCKDTCNNPIKKLNSNSDLRKTKSRGSKCSLFYKDYSADWRNIADTNNNTFLPIIKTNSKNYKATENQKLFYRLCGYFVGDGHLQHPRKRKSGRVNGYGFSISFNKKNKEHIQDVLTIMKTLFNKEKYNNETKKNCVKLTFYSKKLYYFFKNNFYNIPANNELGKGNGVYTCKYKTIPINFLSIRLCLQKEFISGHLNSDGYVRKNGQTSIYVTSRYLEILVGIMLNNVYGNHTKTYRKISTKNSTIDGRKIIGKNDGVNLEFGINSNRLITVDGVQYKKSLVINNSNILTTFDVFNYEVENDHSYIVDGYIPAHNCLRSLTFKVIDNKLSMSIFFRSNDLYAGFCTNLAGLELLKQYIASEANLENGKIYYASDGLHIYNNQLDIVNTRLNRKC